jgi:hypothetical protein
LKNIKNLEKKPIKGGIPAIENKIIASTTEETLLTPFIAERSDNESRDLA